MTSLQLEPSAQAPCTSTTFLAVTGASCAEAAPAKTSVESRLIAATTNVRGLIGIAPTPSGPSGCRYGRPAATRAIASSAPTQRLAIPAGSDSGAAGCGAAAFAVAATIAAATRLAAA